MADELLDLVNEKDEIIGTVWKSEAHKNPRLIHREVGLVIFNDQGETLLQQRSMKKKVEPGLWKIAAAGHIDSGEEAVSAVKREAQEELGLEIDPIFVEKSPIQYKEHEAHITYIYYAIVSGNPALILDEVEVMATEWAKVDKLNEFSKTHAFDLGSLSYKMTVKVAKLLGLLV